MTVLPEPARPSDLGWGPTRPTCASTADAPSIKIISALDGFTAEDAARALAGLPPPGDYEVVVKALRYRAHPSLSALCEFDVRRIVLRVPEPFQPWNEVVYHAARRKPGPGWTFEWVSDTVPFRQRREVLRFLYCHEWMHWYLREVLGRRSGAETACDRFALRNFQRQQVVIADAVAALAYRGLPSAATQGHPIAA
jgi:TPR repeat protein